jgi:lambda repressor-like predicted transcriptional regulator
VDIPDVWTFIEMRRKRTVYVLMNSEKVWSLREQKGISKRDLATEAGGSVSTSKRVEREAPVTFRTGRVVAEALGVEPSPSVGRVL